MLEAIIAIFLFFAVCVFVFGLMLSALGLVLGILFNPYTYVVILIISFFIVIGGNNK